MAAALLSRFDLVFLLLDKADEGRDKLVSEHIMKTHNIASNTHNLDSTNIYSDSSSSARMDSLLGALNNPLNNNNAKKRNFSEFSQSNIVTSEKDPLSTDSMTDITLTQRLRRMCTAFEANPVPQDVLRQYISYSRMYCHPRLTPSAAKVLQRLYLGMRAQSKLGDTLPVTTRHLESLIRLAQARCKLELREEVS